MKLSGSLGIAIVAASALCSAAAHAGPMPTHVATIKSMVDQSTTEVRWGGWRGGGFGYRGVGFRGGGWGYRRLGYGVAAGAIVGGAIASSYYGGYGGYGGYYGSPAYSCAASPYYGYGCGYGYGASYCPPYGGYAARYYGW